MLSRMLPLVVALGLPSLAAAQDPSLEAPTPASQTGRGDHGRALGHIAWAAFSDVANVQLGNPGSILNVGATTITVGAATANTVSTPALGVRWWAMHNNTLDLGLDAGLGFVFSTVSSSTTGPGTAANTTVTTTTSAPGASGIYLHVGLPLALLPSEHGVLNIIPEVDIGGAWANGNTTQAGGFLLNLGGRIGPEIHLGFFGVPQFSVQPTVSLFLNVNNYGASATITGATTTKGSNSNTTVSFFTAGMGLSFFYYPTVS